MGSGLEPIRVEDCLEQHRAALTAHCRRLVGANEAEDAVQETLIRAWRGYERFEGRSSPRSWLQRIATNVCFDMLDGRRRRPWPVDLGPAAAAEHAAQPGSLPPEHAPPTPATPEEAVLERESVRLAFVVALRDLPPMQRAVLILREVFRWRASEVAEVLQTSIPSVNSALQRARGTLQTTGASASTTSPALDDQGSRLLARYVEAFAQYDMDALTTLLREDASRRTTPPARARAGAAAAIRVPA